MPATTTELLWNVVTWVVSIIAAGFVVVWMFRDILTALTRKKDDWWKNPPPGRQVLPMIAATPMELDIAKDIGVFPGAQLETKIAQAIAYRRRRIERDFEISIEDDTKRFRTIPPPPMNNPLPTPSPLAKRGKR